MAYGYNNSPQQGPSYNQGMPQQIPTQNVQPLFPQPQGNVYNINSTLEVANVPVGAGISVALCMPENVMFIKTMQNGNPLFYPYKIMPFNNEVETPAPAQERKEDIAEQMENCIKRLDELEALVKTKKKGAEFAV